MDKKTAFWIVVFFIALFTFNYGRNNSSNHYVNNRVESALVMSELDAETTKCTIGMICEEIDKGHYTDTNDVLNVLKGNLPESVRNQVMRAVGNPDFSTLKDKLNTIADKIKKE